MRKLFLHLSCIILLFLCGFSKIDLASASKSDSQSYGVKKGDIKITQNVDGYRGNTWYVISDAIFKDNEIQYYNGNHKITNVTIYDENYHVIGTIKNAVTKEYFQVLKDGRPFEVGLLSKRKNNTDVNFFGWYHGGYESWILPCQYAKIEVLNASILLATTWKNQSKETVQIYNLYNDAALKTSINTKQFEELVHSCGSYYWIYNGKNTYEIYNEKLQWIRTVKYSEDQIYYDNGEVRVSKEQVLTSLGVQKPKEACLTMKTLCWPKQEETLLCNITPQKNVGYQETDDYIINQKYKEVYHQNLAFARISRYKDYYLCFSDGNFVDCKVYKIDGKQVISKSGIPANGMVDSNEGNNFYGYQNGNMHIFTPAGEDVLAFPTKDPTEDKYTLFKEIVGQCNNVAVVIDEITGISIYYKNKLILTDTFDNERPVVQMCNQRNGDVLIRMNQRLLCITDTGEIYLDQIINGTRDGKMITVFDEGYVTCCKGKTNVTKLNKIREDQVTIQSEFSTKYEPIYYVVSDWSVKWVRIEGKESTTSNVTIMDENYKVIKTIQNALAKEYFQVIHGDSPVEIGLLSERKNDDMNFFGWYQPNQDRWLLPCKYNSIYSNNRYVQLTTIDKSKHPETQILQVVNRKNNKCIQASGDLYALKYELFITYGDYYWFYNEKSEYEIYDEDFNLIRKLTPKDDKLYYEDGTVRTTKYDLLVALGIKNIKKDKITMSGLCWPSNQN